MTKGYELRKRDIFSVSYDSFKKNPDLLFHCTIINVHRFKRKWWQLWKPKWTYYVQLEFQGV